MVSADWRIVSVKSHKEMKQYNKRIINL
uniref:Uncharacterized protein n=1 Tax=Arundo donax TaxID=35708 RepID=A0A0A9BDZ2_ARUDO